MALLKQSTAYTRMFLMVDSADHITGKTGLTVTLTLSKAGGSFGAAGGTITEVTSGWYKVALSTTDTNTLGDLAYHATGTGADATDFVDQVSVRLPDDLAFPATSGRSMVVDASGLVDANAVKVGPTASGTAQTARDLGASVLLSTGTGTGQLDFTSGVVKANATQWLGGTIPAVSVTGVPLVDLKYTLGTISPATAGSVRADAVTGAVGSVTGAVGSVTGSVGGNVVGSVASVTAGVTVTTNNDKTGYRLSATGVDDLLRAALTEGYAAQGVAPTLEQFLFMLLQELQEFAIVGTTRTVKKLDRSTAAMTETLNDATNPTALTRAT